MLKADNPSNIVLIVIVAILIAVIVGCAILIIILRVRKNKSVKIDESEDDIRLVAIQSEIRRLEKERNKFKNKLKNIKNLNQEDEYKEIINQELSEYKKQRLVEIEKELDSKKNEILKNTILDVMQPLHLKIINEASAVYLPISEKAKPLLIGKKGQNIKRLNEITGCNINIDKNKDFIEISSPNPYDRTLAMNIVKHIFKSEAYDIIAIENIYKKEKRLIDQDIYNTGKEYLTKLNISVPDMKICEYIGRLKYRWSFGQNALEHCYEVAVICEKLAQEFGLDSDIAKQIGFFHDLGKSIDYESKYDHISSGVWIAKQFKLDPEVINGIYKHHRTNCYEDYVLLVRCADAWSAARIGARHFPESSNEKTISILEEKCSKIKNVMSFKAMMVDNEIQIMFIPLINSSKAYAKTKYDIIKAIKKDVRLNKHRIKFVNEIIN